MCRFCVGLFAWSLCAGPLWAHHSTLPYDGTKPTTVSGIVAKLNWSHPHTYIVVDVRDAQGDVTHWTIESESPHLLTRLGWTKESIKPGEWIRVTGARARNGDPAIRCRTVDLPGGKTLPCFPIEK